MQVGCWDGDAPVAVGIHGAGIGFTAQGDRNGLPWRGDAGGPRYGLRLACLRAVQDAIAKRRVQGGVRQSVDKHAQIMAVADQIAALIDGADADGGVAIGQQGQIGGRNLNAPGTVWQGQADVNLAIQRHGDDGTERQIGAVAGDRQRLQTFGQVEFVIPCDHGDGKPTEVGIDGHVMAGVGRVTCSVVDGGGNGGLAVGQQCQVGRRYAGAPGTIGQHGRRVGFAVQGDGDGLARFHMGGGTGQGLSSFHLRAVDNVVTGEHVDAERR
ncbi:hypothetical protein D3C79_689660 [compost metagenome]